MKFEEGSHFQYGAGDDDQGAAARGENWGGGQSEGEGAYHQCSMITCDRFSIIEKEYKAETFV